MDTAVTYPIECIKLRRVGQYLRAAQRLRQCARDRYAAYNPVRATFSDTTQ